MKLRLTAVKLPPKDFEKIQSWVALYNRFHEDRQDFKKLNYSDVFRFAVQLWLEQKIPQKEFFPA